LRLLCRGVANRPAKGRGGAAIKRCQRLLIIPLFHYNGIMENLIAVRAFLALGQETRLNIFRLIVQRGTDGLFPSQIQEMLGIPAATLSFHLRELISSGLLSVERQSRNLIYRANGTLTNQLLEFLVDNCCGGKPCAVTRKKIKTRSS